MAVAWFEKVAEFRNKAYGELDGVGDQGQDSWAFLRWSDIQAIEPPA